MGLFEPHGRHRGRPGCARLIAPPATDAPHRLPAEVALRIAADAGLAATRAALVAAGFGPGGGPGHRVILTTTAATSALMGPGWLAGLRDALRAERPDLAIDTLFDCADTPGLALAAVRCGLGVRFAATAPAAAALAGLCAAAGLAWEADAAG